MFFDKKLCSTKNQTSRPLAIKKLLDDDHESDDLDTDMTVADVFVDKGKACSDGLDQRRAVRVIQKPTGGEDSPLRFPSVSQDWDAAAEHYEVQRQKKLKQEAESAVNKLGPIAEEAGRGLGSESPSANNDWAEYTPRRTHRRDMPVSSVEKEVEIPGSPSQPTQEASQGVNGEGNAAPQDDRLESEELGDSPRSSRAVTPKEATPRPQSSHSQASGKRSRTGDPMTDSPALQLAREHTHSVSPQKKAAPEATKPGSKALNGESSSEDESESEESEKSEEGEDEKEKEQQDTDGDVAMGDETLHDKRIESAATKEPKSTTETHVAEPSDETRSRKRKNSADQKSPNKEPRLGRATPPPIANGERRNSAASPETPRFSPSGKRMGGTASFSGVARRLSFSERGSESPSKGLGLGITKSPPKKPPVTADLPQDDQSQEVIPQSPAAPKSSAPTRESPTQTTSTPKDLHTPADHANLPHSSVRKEASEKNSARRSVSFADGEDSHISRSQPAPTSTPNAVKPGNDKVAAQTASSERRRSGSKMVYPPGVSMERIAQLSRQVEEEAERQNKEKGEFENKIKSAETDNADPNYVNKLKAAFQNWESIAKIGNSHRQDLVARRTRLQALLEQQQAEIKEMEESIKKAPSQDKEKKTRASKKTRSSQGTEGDTMAQKSTTKPVTKDDRQSPVNQVSGWNAINTKAPSKNAKAPKAPADGTGSKPPPKAPVARTVATRTLSQPLPSASQNSTASDDVDLPAMKVQARANAEKSNKKSNEATSSESEEESEEESSSGSSESESESSSESESESSSENETEKKPAPSSTKTSAPKSSQKPKATSPPPAQRTSQQPSQSQTESWRWPRNSQPGNNSRLSLKSIKGEVANQAQAQAAAKAAPAKRANQGRKDIFSPPDSDSDDTESESESESESSDDGDDSENKIKAKGKIREQTPNSVADAGDITATGHVQRLRTARSNRN